jgi:ankyrin repeat protein
MNGETAVHIAAMKDKQDIAKLLMAKGGDAKMKNFKGKTPLDIAKDAKNKQMTLILKKIKK